MEVKERDKLYLERLLKHQENSRNKKFYAIQRIDLLIISISGAGIYVVFEIIKFIKEKSIVVDPLQLKAAGMLFTIAIAMNFISQWTGYKANSLEVDKTELDIDDAKGDEIDQSEYENLETRISRNNSVTGILNFGSTVLMLAGIVFLTIFNFRLF